MHDRLTRFLADRPHARVVDAHGDLAATMDAVRDALDAG
jgi:hypothetical protein